MDGTGTRTARDDTPETTLDRAYRELMALMNLPGELAIALHAVDDDIQCFRRDARNFDVIARRVLAVLADRLEVAARLRESR